jgi:hypothetical protein
MRLSSGGGGDGAALSVQWIVAAAMVRNAKAPKGFRTSLIGS